MFRPSALFALVLASALIAGARAQDYIWIEAEKPSATPKMKPSDGKAGDPGFGFSGWGNVAIISEGKVLHFSTTIGEAAARFPAEGAIFAYDFDVKSPGDYTLWGRVGFESARCDFDWRLDGGKWKTFSSEAPTQDIRLLVDFCELAWSQFDRPTLSAGKHRLEIRVERPEAAAGEPDEANAETAAPAGKKAAKKTGARKAAKPPRSQRMLFMLDCFCLAQGDFRPCGAAKPDQDPRDDTDRKAAAQVYELQPAAQAGQRAMAQLDGLWEIANWEDFDVTVENRMDPVAALPADMDKLIWRAIETPGDRDSQRDDMANAHRCIYRTRVNVPAALAGQGFFLRLNDFGMIATVFVNGVNCGWSKAFRAPYQCDVTAAIKPGAVNEIAVVIKDCLYSVKAPGKPVRDNWRMTPKMLMDGRHFNCDAPVTGGGHLAGLIGPVQLVATGTAYTTDVFCKPSVKKKELALEVTVQNATARDAKVTIDNEVIPWNGGQGGAPEMKFASTEAALPAGKSAVLHITGKWANPRLWWPDDPQLYWVVTRVSAGGKVLDETRTRFGFREWEWDSADFKLNGVKWQLWADTANPKSPKAFAEMARTTGHRMTRYWRSGGWGPGQTREDSLNELDELGVPVRSSGLFDGQHMNFGTTEGDRNDKRPKKSLFDNWIAQMDGWIRAERNHPSIFIWSIENEIVYIAINNTNNNDVSEPEIRRGAESVMKLDPTRPVMVDGGRALTDMSLPVNGCHYDDLSGCELRDYPDAAYTQEHWFRVKGRDQWPMAPNKPIFHGECFFANGWTPGKFATIGGEESFVGTAQTRPARALYGRILSEGWRWCGVAAWHFWLGDGGYYNSWQPVCVLCREWNWTFGGGTKVSRTLKVFNDTRHANPITWAWALVVDGNRVDGKEETLTIPAGQAQEKEISFAVPPVKERTKAEFILTCSRSGKEVFREVKPVWILDAGAAPKPGIAKEELVVLDPNGSVKERLKDRGVAFSEAPNAASIPATARVVILGKDAVSAKEAADAMWLRLAAGGARILALEQAHPLQAQATIADFETTNYTGRIAFPQDLGHPIFAGLDTPDFFTWSQDHVVYRNAYKKPVKGARSLVQCDESLGCTALAESEVNDGLMVFCQLAVGEKLAFDPVAQRLFDNMLAYAAAYTPLRRKVAVCVDPASPRAKALGSIGLAYMDVKEPMAALAPQFGVAVIEASPANLKAMAASLDKLKAFAENGGWIMLMGLTPEGLADYNRLVGFDHLIRPFQMERVVLAMPPDSLTAGLTLRDVVMEDSEKIVKYKSDRWMADDAFTYIVDYTDIAPFAKMPAPEDFGKADVQPRTDGLPSNMVNGFDHNDDWRYTFVIHYEQGEKTKWTMELPREEILTGFGVLVGIAYRPITQIKLYCDDDPNPTVFDLKPEGIREDFPIPDRKARRVTLEMAKWEENEKKPNIGIDNLWLTVQRPEAFLKNVKSLLNIGGLMRYNIGQGGIVLNQLNFVERERLPINAEKKATITKTILKNLGAEFQGGKTLVAGANAKYDPVAIPDSTFNAFITREGSPAWFAHKTGDLRRLPLGEDKFAGVTYRVLNFETSPIPSCIMLKSAEGKVDAEAVRGIRVGKTCDALFFLHTFGASRDALRWSPVASKNKPALSPPVVFRYVIHYADGQTAEAPVVWKQGVNHWVSEGEPAALRDAAVGWAAPLPEAPPSKNKTAKSKGGKKGQAETAPAAPEAPEALSSQQAVVYSMQWNNPRPEAEIASIDIEYGPDGPKWGSPAVFAITAASLAK